MQTICKLYANYMQIICKLYANYTFFGSVQYTRYCLSAVYMYVETRDTHTVRHQRPTTIRSRISPSPECTVPYGAAIDYTLHWYARHRPPCTCPMVLDRYMYPIGHPDRRSARRDMRYDIATALRGLHTSSFHKTRVHRSVRCGD